MDQLRTWLNLASVQPWVQGTIVTLGAAAIFLIARLLVARGLTYVAQRTKNKYDDIVVRHLRPFRFAWIAPLLVLYYFADLLPAGVDLAHQILLFLILWLVLVTVNALLNAANEIYEASPLYRGEAIQGYLDLIKLAMTMAGLVLTFSLFTGKSPVVLLSGLGALMALLLLIFRDTLLSFMANIQIHSHDLVKEGDWIEMPEYGADGDVTNISLNTVKIQNWDKTITVIPTYKFLDAPYRNWRGMQESGGRRIKRAIHIDLNTVHFCDPEMIDRFQKIDLVREYVTSRLSEAAQWKKTHDGSSGNPFAGPQLTNVGVFRAYVTNYLKQRPDLHWQGMTMLVRQLDPGPTGLPLEVYVFAKTTEWVEYEGIQADIFEHLVAAVPQFGLRVFQEPTGVDFRVLGETQTVTEGRGGRG